jgi:hypothetical protein
MCIRDRTISYSKGDFKVANEEEREKLQSILDKLNFKNLLNISLGSGILGLHDIATSYMSNQPDNSDSIPFLVGAIAAIAAITVPDSIQKKNIVIDYKGHNNPKMEQIIFKYISNYRASAREYKTPYNYQNLLNQLTNYAPKNIIMYFIHKYEKENNIKIPRINPDENKKSNNLINRLLGR